MESMVSNLNIETLIVGAGFSGICMGIKLKQAGRTSFLIVEKSGDLGGTWAENKYPACACDVESHLYCYSFYPNPDWNRIYATASEIQNYLYSCAAHYGLLPRYVRFHTRAASAVWDKGAALWRVHLVTEDGSKPYTIRARFLVSAVGALSVPKLPSVAGVKSFGGVSIHSNQWTRSIDELIGGKRVAVIGTGASAIQIVPEVARVAQKLYVVQRSPTWVRPKFDANVSELWKWVFRHVPLVLWLWRMFLFLYRELVFGTTYWGAPQLYRRVMQKLGESISLSHMKAHIKDPELRRQLTPTHALGCKRVLLSNDYYPALARPNVEVISGSLVEVRQNGILVKTHDDSLQAVDDLDVVIYATGFDLSRPKIHVVGSNHDSPLLGAASPSFLGITKHGFPNFFTMLGPHSALGHNSVILMAEAQARYILSCIDLLKSQDPQISSLEVKLATQERFQAFLRRRFPHTVWRRGGCTGWYFDSKSGENPFIWPASVVEYIFYTLYAKSDDYEFTS